MSNERRRQGPRGPMGHGMRGNGEKAKNEWVLINLGNEQRWFYFGEKGLMKI